MLTFDEWLGAQGSMYTRVAPSWVLRVAYNQGFISRNEEVARLEHALRRVLPLCESYVQDFGVCDHSVSLCSCEEKDALAELKRVLGKEQENGN